MLIQYVARLLKSFAPRPGPWAASVTSMCYVLIAVLALGLLPSCGTVDDAGNQVISPPAESAVTTTAVVIRTCSQYQGEPAPTCVDSGDLRTIYNDALQRCASHGCANPVAAMWAAAPDDPDVASLGAWNARKDGILAFFTPVEAYIESRRDSLSKLVDQQKTMKDRLEAKVRPLDDAIKQATDGTRDWIQDAGAVATSSAQAEAARAKESLRVLGQITADYGNAMRAPANALGDMAVTFRNYRNTEGAAISSLSGIANDGSSAATFDAIANQKIRLVGVSKQESAAAADIMLQTSRLRGPFVAVQSIYERRLLPYLQFMQQRELPILDLAVQGTSALDKMTDYARRRDMRLAAAIVQIVTGLNQRLSALIAVAADNQTRTAMRQAAFLKSSQAFLAQVNAQVAIMLAVPPRTPVLGLRKYGDQYSRITQFLELAPLCASASATAAWMQSGCAVVGVNITKANNLLRTNIPGSIRLGFSVLQSHGVSSSQIEQIRTALTEGRLLDAIVMYDASLNAAEGAQ